MTCDFHTVAFMDGVFTLECRRCGTRRQTTAEKFTRKCDAAVTAATAGSETPPVDSALLVRRIAICHRCTDRPADCWRTKEYGCMIEYHKAGRRTAETGSCPLGKLIFPLDAFSGDI